MASLDSCEFRDPAGRPEPVAGIALGLPRPFRERILRGSLSLTTVERRGQPERAARPKSQSEKQSLALGRQRLLGPSRAVVRERPPERLLDADTGHWSAPRPERHGRKKSRHSTHRRNRGHHARGKARLDKVASDRIRPIADMAPSPAKVLCGRQSRRSQRLRATHTAGELPRPGTALATLMGGPCWESARIIRPRHLSPAQPEPTARQRSLLQGD
jgi:hypothetical protein